MRLGLLTTSFPRYEGDIAGHFVLGFARTLVTLGHTVEVIAPEPAHGSAPPYWCNISVRWTPYMRPREFARTFYGAGVPDNLAASPLAWLGVAPFMVALVGQVLKARRGWDAIVSHWALPCAVVAGALSQDRPHVAVFHSADIHLLRRLPSRYFIAGRLASRAHRLLFVAPALRDLFLELLPETDRNRVSERCAVIPMGIEPIPPTGDARDLIRHRVGFSQFTLVFLGRLVPVKGVDDAIRALACRRDLEFVVVGEGPERPALERLARHLHAPVRFVGKISGPDKHDVLRAADAFISTSRILASGRTEGTPTSLIEAMAHGLPIIATEVGGVGSLLRHMKSALLVPPGDQTAIRKSVDLLMGDRALRTRLGIQCAAQSSELLWPSLAGRLASLFSP